MYIQYVVGLPILILLILIIFYYIKKSKIHKLSLYDKVDRFKELHVIEIFIALVFVIAAAIIIYTILLSNNTTVAKSAICNYVDGYLIHTDELDYEPYIYKDNITDNYAELNKIYVGSYGLSGSMVSVVKNYNEIEKYKNSSDYAGSGAADQAAAAALEIYSITLNKGDTIRVYYDAIISNNGTVLYFEVTDCEVISYAVEP